MYSWLLFTGQNQKKKMIKRSMVGFFFLITIKIVPLSAQYQEVEIEHPFFLGAGPGVTLTSPSDIHLFERKPGFSGNIPVFIGGIINNRHVLQLDYFFEDYFPLQQHNYRYTKEETRSPFLISSININSVTLGISYGRKIPFKLFRNNFNFIPKIGLLAGFIKDIKQLDPQNHFVKSLAGDPIDTLVVDNRSIFDLKKANLFITVGPEVETMILKPRLTLFLRMVYNFSLQNTFDTRFSYYLKSDNSINNVSIPNRLSHGHVSFGLKYYLKNI